MKVTVKQLVGATFVAESPSGARFEMEGSAELGGTGERFRPMEAVLASLAGCSGIDVVKILTQQKEPLQGLTITVDGERADAVPAVFTKIHLRFEIRGNVAENKAERAVALSADKYCSVAKMLEPTVAITHEVVLVPAAP